MNPSRAPSGLVTALICTVIFILKLTIMLCLTSAVGRIINDFQRYPGILLLKTSFMSDAYSKSTGIDCNWKIVKSTILYSNEYEHVVQVNSVTYRLIFNLAILLSLFTLTPV